MAEPGLEAERVGASHVGRREGIAPAQLSRWKQKFLQAGIQDLKEIKRGPKQKEDPSILRYEYGDRSYIPSSLGDFLRAASHERIRVARSRGPSLLSAFELGAAKSIIGLY
jgi:hypothetical protein